MEDIMIDISPMQNYKSRLEDLHKKMTDTSDYLLDLNLYIGEVWVDPESLEFRKDMIDCINGLLDIAAYAQYAIDICSLACEEYQKADQRVLSALSSGGTGGGGSR